MTVKHWNTGASAVRFRNQQKEQMTQIINGTYKKDMPNEEIGYQKWCVRKTHEVIMEYTIVAKTKKEADNILESKECIKVEDVNDYGDTFRETIVGKHINDFSGDEPVEWKKVEECIPSENLQVLVDSFVLFSPFLFFQRDIFLLQIVIANQLVMQFLLLSVP